MEENPRRHRDRRAQRVGVTQEPGRGSATSRRALPIDVRPPCLDKMCGISGAVRTKACPHVEEST